MLDRAGQQLRTATPLRRQREQALLLRRRRLAPCCGEGMQELMWPVRGD